MLQMTDVTFSYGSRKVLSALNLQAAPGECLVIAGPNGSGKSTLLALLAGVLTPESGTVRTDGRVGYVPQGVALFGDMTVAENLRFFAGLARSPVPSPLPFALEERLHTRVDRLSGGTQRQVSIACALPGDPEVLLLDEPCAGLDIPYRRELTELVLSLKAAGRTVLYAGHEPLELFPLCDRLLFLGDTPRLFTREELAGSPPDPLRFTRRLEELFHPTHQESEV